MRSLVDVAAQLSAALVSGQSTQLQLHHRAETTPDLSEASDSGLRPQPRRLRVSGLRGGARAFFLHHFLARSPWPSLIIAPSDEEAQALEEDLRLFAGEGAAHLYPAWDVPLLDGLSPSVEAATGQIEGLYHLLTAPAPVLVTSVEALLQRVMPQEEFIAATFSVRRGQAIVFDQLLDHLIQWGYRRVPLVEERGEVSVRGGIIDFFPPLSPLPLRLEFLGDEIESIRAFDPSTQRSQAEVEDLCILPMQMFSLTHLRAARRQVEEEMAEEEVKRRERQSIVESLKDSLPFPGMEFFLPYFYPALETLFDYLPAGCLVWLDGPARIENALDACLGRIQERRQAVSSCGKFSVPSARLFLAAAEWQEQLARRSVVELEGLELLESEKGLVVTSSLHTGLKPHLQAKAAEKGLSPLVERIRGWEEERARVFLVVSSQFQASHLHSLLGNYGLNLPVISPTPPLWQEGEDRRTPIILIGGLSQGFMLPADRLVFVAEEEIFGERRHRRRSRPRPVADYLTGLSQLKVGDLVVHLDHGIGLYRGLRHLRVAGTEGDFLHLEYAGGDRLYLPVERINLVQKYMGADGATPALDKLGSTSWEKVKKKTKESILAMAHELLQVHATREVAERPPLPATDGYYEEFCARFPFEETPGQQAAIDDVIVDLRKSKPMDRLVCGDVGYGKTEVALRAALLAAVDGRQVAVLVPTTVLAQQHFETFRQRFSGYPVNIEMLSRFRSPRENRAVIQGLASGTVDIVIGTHRLLQADVTFKNLGLLIIDEEHRFGVVHKEKIKKLRHLADVLTLSATPIPRTLNMSLMGLRDLSVIETPPVDRQAIRTYVTRFDEGIIRTAVLQELSRRGQVFFVHNRVETIELMARKLRELIPEARLAVAHGQMSERVLEKVMLDFLHNRSNLLLCSAIIESGLDISNANTIIINRADQFGLAQLYQLRGRVGRSSQRAYAYLLIPGEHIITREAARRLEVLQELDDLGGGFRIAAHDLEIRGAGNLLGKEQSGHIAAVGFELYAWMLEETVQELCGGQPVVQLEPEIQIGVPAYIPDNYVPDVNQRLVFYKKLAGARSVEEIEEVTEELVDRYGPLPVEAEAFLRVMDLRRLMKELLVVAARKRGERVTLQFHPESPVRGERIVALAQKEKGRFQLSPDLHFSFLLKGQEEVISATKTLLQSLGESC